MKDLVSEGFANVVKPYIDTKIAAVNQTLTNKLDDEIDARAELGAHQRLDYSVESLKALNTSGTWNGNTYSLNSVDFTINSDLSISVSGTASANADLRLARGDLSGFSGMILSGNPLSDNSIASLSLYKNASPYTYYANCNDTTEKTVSEIPSGEEQILMLRIASGKTVGADFSPLLRVASDLSKKFVPYAMTNKELTDFATLADLLVSNSASRIIPENTLPSELTNGVYRFDSGRTTGLWAGYGVIVLTLKNSTPNGVQLAFKIGASSDVSSDYVAYRLGYSNTWSNWTKLSGTNVT